MAALVNALKMTYVNIGTVRPARESISRALEVQPIVSPEFFKKFRHNAAPAGSKRHQKSRKMLKPGNNMVPMGKL